MRIICLESGGSKLVATLAGSNGRLIDRIVLARPAGQVASETLLQLCSAGQELAAGLPVDGVGFGFGGTVCRSERRPVHCYHETGWEDLEAHEILSREFEAPVFVENDCNLAALAEALSTPRFGTDTLLYVTVGTGIGAGIISRGRIVQLGDLGEGEVGHIVVEPSGPSCECGNRGCLETLCSGPGFLNLSRQIVGIQIDSRTVMQRYRSGDLEAGQIVAAAAGYMAAALAAAVTLLAPSVIVFGGGVMTDNQPFLQEIRRRTLELAFPPFVRPETRFTLSRLRENVVCQGAAFFVLQQLEQLEASR
jgi:glucokinase